ncbi:hypothetical protein A3C23_00175 [Candidatus Roizmanbacteria bacterium RIFCSPHIGHO2_02_FULL_37_13b]|uniref:ATP-grasp domain-containing protein n=1 Tax=Candidatus Roizmanbacteria bacterium RIFCSPLOWO2_02_FULL_36_11 TaxID=1802071 RepID=A0A1F7JHN7_9BACT|nr:MAG: hypothetical protein A3C23_00175 [Candidatus Roizmanbacteria bacterium RIFCSPHIGHO2_02_FULL_37_13b]OGK55116.1 MAG: hypothetical protein A3H78_03985 [Candidatus Roizmanbacteria bacterium RIFCSPLOWO2_02_FULL_36_11]
MDYQKYTIATLGSHSALQILHGAKAENFNTLLITTPDREKFYKRFSFIDEVKTIPTFADFPTVEKDLKDKNVIIIPHGSFVAYLGVEKNKNMTLAYFGNKAVLDWEQDRDKQKKWLLESKINMPPQYDSIEKAQFPVIVKSFGAAGGAGYFLAKEKQEFENKIKTFKSNKYIIQKYILGVTLYIHYFYSALTNSLEILSMDRRYETNADGLGRIPAIMQQEIDIDPSYVVVGNSPLVLRESMLPEAYDMGERLVASSKKLISDKGLFGPFCLETIITPDMNFYAIEVSARIVAGTNLFTDTSPYSIFHHEKPVSTGRRIAMEIKQAISENKLELILD